MLHAMAYRSPPKLIPCFLPVFRIFKLEFLTQALISRQMVNENVISVHLNLQVWMSTSRDKSIFEN